MLPAWSAVAFGEGDGGRDFGRLIGCLGGKGGNNGANKCDSQRARRVMIPSFQAKRLEV